MKPLQPIACLVIILLFAVNAPAKPVRISDGHNQTVQSTSTSSSRAPVQLIGPMSACPGDFETGWGPWTHHDLTATAEPDHPLWKASDFNAVAGDYSAWCGSACYASCGGADIAGGYGPNYNEYLSWSLTVDPSKTTTVTVTAQVSYDTETDCDFCSLGFHKDGQPFSAPWSVSGKATNVPVTASTVYAIGDYVGAAHNEIKVSWLVTSDMAYDDNDCEWPSAGAIQVDDVSITVIVDGFVTHQYFENFESGSLQQWYADYSHGVGDYAHITNGLCDSNSNPNPSQQVCFVADGVRGLPTIPGGIWTYGPAGCIVPNQNAPSGPGSPLHNAIRSPVLAWPSGLPGCASARLDFEVYRHEELTSDSPGMFYTWGIRSTASEDPGDIECESFRNRGFVYYGAPGYVHNGDDNVGNLLVANRKWVQVELSVHELGYIWGWCGADGTPAPYFDNVILEADEPAGPVITALETDLVQDAFPTDGLIHVGVDMGLNDIRFDMAKNISEPDHRWNDPGDSIVVSIASVCGGSSVVTSYVGGATPPTLYFVIKLNPAFDMSVRLPVGPFTVNSGTTGELVGGITSNTGGVMEGFVVGDHAVADGETSADKWMFDLPDLDFLYPGDVLHCYIEAWAVADGNYSASSLPEDLSRYGDFSDILAYDKPFVVRGLPTLFDDAGNQPKILFWNDFADRRAQGAWHGGFKNLNKIPGFDYDTYYTNAPGSAVGNGLGGRAQFGQLDGYDTIVYSCGDFATATITNSDYAFDAGDDVGLLTHWLDGGFKFLFATGDNLASDLNGSGAAAVAFLENALGVTSVAPNIRVHTGEVPYPIIERTGSSVWTKPNAWVVLGRNGSRNAFDCVSLSGAATAEAVFPTGPPAATRYGRGDGSTIVSMPYDWSFIITPPAIPIPKADQPASLSARVLLLNEILTDAGHPGEPGAGTAVPERASAFSARAYPNPFNPVTRIEYMVPRAGHLSVKVYNVRGELVRTLIDEFTAAGPGHLSWDGTSDQGQDVSSGVYFCEVRTGGEAKIQKLALLK